VVVDMRFQPSRSGPPRNEAALEEIRRLFERYRAHPDSRVRSLPPRHAKAVPSHDADRIPRENLVSR
jgi:hypothetical protein